MKKARADVMLVERGLVDSRAKAQALIMAGLVYSGDVKLMKAGQQLPEDCTLTVRGKEHPWVSRGGLKLEKAITFFEIDMRDSVVIDVGASTGGFTDVALENGARRVFAVDVGRGQLAWKLRNDERVSVLEKTNARYLDGTHITELVDFVVCDASFISLKTVLPAALEFVKEGGGLVALIKPQFEVGRGKVGKGGVVRDPLLHQEVCEEIKTWLNDLKAWSVIGITESPIKGPEGNIEFLIYARKHQATIKQQEQCS